MSAEPISVAAAATPPAPRSRRAVAGRAWAALPVALVRGGLDLLRPGRLLAWVVLSLLAAVPPTALALWAWDTAVAWAQGDLLASPLFAWWVDAAERAGMGGLRAMLGPVLILALWWPAVLGLVAWVQQVALFPVPRGTSRAARALGGLALVLVFWAGWLLGLPLALWLMLFPMAGVVVPLLLWAWLLARLAGPLPAGLAPAARGAAVLIALASLLPPVALAAPLWLARTVEQLRARSMTEAVDG